MKQLIFPLKLDDCILYAACCDCTAASLDADEKLYRIICVNSGNLDVTVNGETKRVKKGQCFIAFPYEKCDLFFDTADGTSYSLVAFSVDSVKFAGVAGHMDQRLFPNNPFCDDNVRLTISNICKELSSGDEMFSKELISLLCSQLILYVLRASANDNSKSDVGNDANIKICTQVMNLIDSRIYSMKNLREIAAEMGYNYSYISTLFRKTCGMTLNMYFKSRRMNEAKKLLSNREISVSEIARMMNYSSVYAFSKAFKEHFGTSPGHYSGRFPQSTK